MTQEHTFRCANSNCNQVSDYRERVTRRVEHATPRGTAAGDAFRSEIRTYRCQHCQTENLVTKPAGFWLLVDESGKVQDA